MRNSLRITVLLLAVGLVVLAAGCGGGKKAAANKIGATGTLGSTGTTGAVGTTSHPGATGAAGSFASAKNCRDFAGLAATIASAMSTGSGNPATAVENESQQLQALVDAAPSDIKADFQTFADSFASYLQALENAGYEPGQPLTIPSATQLAKFAAAARVFNSKKLQQAEQHLSNWVQANCN